MQFVDKQKKKKNVDMNFFVVDKFFVVYNREDREKKKLGKPRDMGGVGEQMGKKTTIDSLQK